MQGNKGFIGYLILIIIALAFLKYFFNWSIFDVVASEEGRSTINYIREILNTVWSYVRIPVLFIWQRVLELIPSRLIFMNPV